MVTWGPQDTYILVLDLSTRNMFQTANIWDASQQQIQSVIGGVISLTAISVLTQPPKKQLVDLGNGDEQTPVILCSQDRRVQGGLGPGFSQDRWVQGFSQ